MYLYLCHLNKYINNIPFIGVGGDNEFNICVGDGTSCDNESNNDVGDGTRCDFGVFKYISSDTLIYSVSLGFVIVIIQ